MRVASWNVNSINVRLTQVLEWFDKQEIDILALQETKVIDTNFPQDIFHSKGLHVSFSGQKTYNGMAIISRYPIENVLTDIPQLQDPQRRILAANICDLRIINLYVPNGSTPNSEKYLYKLDWLEKVTEFVQSEMKNHEKIILLGDFNIAPTELDVHDPSEWEGSVLVSPAERASLQGVLNLGFYDIFRYLNPNVQAYTWWDYRAASFRRNRGLRIDLILVTQALLSQTTCCVIDKEPRKHPQPSDHTPLIIALEK